MDNNSSKTSRTIDAGEGLISWEAWEFEPQTRSTRWYVAIVCIGIALIIYAILASNPIFALIILMTGVLILINSLHKPKRIQIHITTDGIVFGKQFHEYTDLKDFSIIYQPPVKKLYIDFKRFYRPIMSIDLADVDAIAVRDTLLQFIDENIEREDQLMTDLARQSFKL